MTKKLAKVSLIYLLLLSLTLISSQINAFSLNKTILEDTSPHDIVKVSLYNASYGDYDGDGNLDDIECFASVSFSQVINRKKFDIYTHLFLPNGDVYGYLIMVNTFRSRMEFQLLFFNHAYVSGDYTITMEVYLAQKGNFFSDFTYIVFDPPRDEEPDSDPIFEVRV